MRLNAAHGSSLRKDRLRDPVTPRLNHGLALLVWVLLHVICGDNLRAAAADCPACRCPLTLASAHGGVPMPALATVAITKIRR